MAPESYGLYNNKFIFSSLLSFWVSSASGYGLGSGSLKCLHSEACTKGTGAPWDMFFSQQIRERKPCKQISVYLTHLLAKASHMAKFNINGVEKYILFTRRGEARSHSKGWDL